MDRLASQVRGTRARAPEHPYVIASLQALDPVSLLGPGEKGGSGETVFLPSAEDARAGWRRGIAVPSPRSTWRSVRKGSVAPNSIVSRIRSFQPRHDLREPRQGRFEVINDLGSDDLGRGQGVGVGQALVPDPERTQAQLVALQQVIVIVGSPASGQGRPRPLSRSERVSSEDYSSKSSHIGHSQLRPVGRSGCMSLSCGLKSW